jgi:hypothetical protein
MRILELLLKNMAEGAAFLLIVIVLFNTLSDFALKLGGITLPLSVPQIQYFGTISAALGLVNVVSHNFFGIRLAN